VNAIDVKITRIDTIRYPDVVLTRKGDRRRTEQELDAIQTTNVSRGDVRQSSKRIASIDNVHNYRFAETFSMCHTFYRKYTKHANVKRDVFRIDPKSINLKRD